MAEFRYRASDAGGHQQRGVLEASGHEAALRMLRARGLTPVELVENGGPPEGGADPLPGGVEVPRSGRWGWLRRSDRGVGSDDVRAVTAELAIMLKAGLPLDRALRLLSGMGIRASLASLLEDVSRSVKSGKALSQALVPHAHVFGEFYVSLIRAGETSGRLAEALGDLSEHLERVKELRDSVVSALIYPAILVVVAFLSVALMLGFVVPQFESLFDDMGEALPLPTQIVVGAGHFVAEYGWLFVVGVVLVASILQRWWATERGRTWKHRRLLALPIFGDVLRKYEITRFTRCMGALLGSGVPIVQAIRTSADTMGNELLRAAMLSVPQAVKQGGRLADALDRTGLFTQFSVNMVRLGEETGRLDSTLLEVARVHDREVQTGVKRALSLIEPALILSLGAIIAAIIVSILMGILSVNELAI